MSTPALRKHFELMMRLGVRTVIGTPRFDTIEGHTVAKTKALHEKIRALLAQGKGDIDIALELDISAQTVGRHRRGKVRSVHK